MTNPIFTVIPNCEQTFTEKNKMFNERDNFDKVLITLQELGFKIALRLKKIVMFDSYVKKSIILIQKGIVVEVDNYYDNTNEIKITCVWEKKTETTCYGKISNLPIGGCCDNRNEKEIITISFQRYWAFLEAYRIILEEEKLGNGRLLNNWSKYKPYLYFGEGIVGEDYEEHKRRSEKMLKQATTNLGIPSFI